jgi:hypothetical protein
MSPTSPTTVTGFTEQMVNFKVTATGWSCGGLLLWFLRYNTQKKVLPGCHQTGQTGWALEVQEIDLLFAASAVCSGEFFLNKSFFSWFCLLNQFFCLFLHRHFAIERTLDTIIEA